MSAPEKPQEGRSFAGPALGLAGLAAVVFALTRPAGPPPEAPPASSAEPVGSSTPSAAPSSAARTGDLPFRREARPDLVQEPPPPTREVPSVWPAWQFPKGQEPVAPIIVVPTLARLSADENRCPEGPRTTLFVLQGGKVLLRLENEKVALPSEKASVDGKDIPARAIGTLLTAAAPFEKATTWLCRGPAIPMTKEGLLASPPRYLLGRTGRGELKLVDQESKVPWRDRPKGIAAITLE